jgi:hypothetical protein
MPLSLDNSADDAPAHLPMPDGQLLAHLKRQTVSDCAYPVWRGLSPMERETAIELAELREAAYEHEGQHQMAEWIRSLIAQLKAGRNQGEQG